jgi:hypothetical protein
VRVRAVLEAWDGDGADFLEPSREGDIGGAAVVEDGLGWLWAVGDVQLESFYDFQALVGIFQDLVWVLDELCRDYSWLSYLYKLIS